jgi:LPXTG-motif cell wall-anchored protein
VHLSYSTTGPNGTFTPIPLYGSTITKDAGAIQGYVGPLPGVTMAPHSSTTYTFHVALASNVPVSKRKPLMAFEGYLDQINPADGTGATLADTYAYQVKVPSEASTSSPPTALIALGGAVLLAIGGFFIWRRGKRPPHDPPPEPAPA